MPRIRITKSELERLIDEGYCKQKRSLTYNAEKDNLLSTKIGCTPSALQELFKAHKDLEAQYRRVQSESKEDALANEIELIDDSQAIATPKAPKEPTPKEPVKQPAPAPAAKKGPGVQMEIPQAKPEADIFGEIPEEEAEESSEDDFDLSSGNEDDPFDMDDIFD